MILDHVTDQANESIGMMSSDKSVEQLQAMLNRYCLSITGSHWEADDLAQDTWLKAIGILLGSGHRNPEAFLLRIAKNTWIDQTRRKTVLARIEKLERCEAALPDSGSFEIETAFHALLIHLSPLQRTVFLLRDVFHYSIAEAAHLLQTSEGAVKAALHRARQSLEAVKDDLRTNILPVPEEESLKELLQALAAAYHAGDIATLVQLAARGDVEPVVAIGIVQNRMLQQLRSASHAVTRHASHNYTQMAA